MTLKFQSSGSCDSEYSLTGPSKPACGPIYTMHNTFLGPVHVGQSTSDAQEGWSIVPRITGTLISLRRPGPPPALSCGICYSQLAGSGHAC